MTDKEKRAERLRAARVHAGFKNATDAAERFGWEVVTYRSHENAIRGLRPTVANIYAKAFKVSNAWLMTGEGAMTGPGIDAAVMALPADISEPLVKAIFAMIANAGPPKGKIPNR